ncbi:MAG: hypothetical protein KDD41_00880 [Flavobacteriales bacterium]|nr:hypothetical protein [Flavobacteriales bacterium]
MNLEFEISPTIEAYEEIFFAKGQGHYFKSPKTKGFFFKFLASLAITISITVISFGIGNLGFDDSPTMLLIFLMILFCIGQIVTIIFFLGFVQKALEIRAWKKQINEYLQRLKTTKIHKIILTDSFMTILQDDHEKILNWSGIIKAEVNNQYISLVSQDHLLIPSKCIEQGRYTEFKNAVSEKIKHAVTKPDQH